MPVVDRFDYRHAAAILAHTRPGLVEEITTLLDSATSNLNLVLESGTQRDLSKQIQSFFLTRGVGWAKERPCSSIPEMKYDLLKDGIPVEIELGHQRLVYPDFFKFLADYSKGKIPAAVMVVTGDPLLFGKDWHCSLRSTRRKIEAICEHFLVPVLIIAVNP